MVYRSFQSMGASPQAGRRMRLASSSLRASAAEARWRENACARACSRVHQPVRGSAPGQLLPRKGRNPAIARTRKSSPAIVWITTITK